MEEERGERSGGGGGVVGEEAISDNSIISVILCWLDRRQRTRKLAPAMINKIAMTLIITYATL